MNPISQLRAAVAAIPSGSLIPVDWVRDQLAGEGEPSTSAPSADLTVEQVAERFGRSPGTVRDWIRAGKLRAYPFNGKEYRVTPAALEEFHQAQREGKQEPAKQQSKPVDLGGWRRVRGKAA